MKTLLTIDINTLEWTEGNHSWFDAKLKANSTIIVSWGDGKTSIMRTDGKDGWCRVSHYYTASKGKQHPFLITFESEDTYALKGLVDGTWENEVVKLSLIDCPGLEYLHYVQLPPTDFSGAPNINTLIVTEYYSDGLDISCLKNLRKLICRGSSIKKLDLTRNDNLEEINISFCSQLRTVVVSNNSKLRMVANNFTEIGTKSLQWLQNTVEKNGGRIQVDGIDEEFISCGTYGEKDK